MNSSNFLGFVRICFEQFEYVCRATGKKFNSSKRVMGISKIFKLDRTHPASSNVFAFRIRITEQFSINIGIQ